MSAKLLRLQTTEEGQAGFGAEQLKVVLNAFFKVPAFLFFQLLRITTKNIGRKCFHERHTLCKVGLGFLLKATTTTTSVVTS